MKVLFFFLIYITQTFIKTEDVQTKANNLTSNNDILKQITEPILEIDDKNKFAKYLKETPRALIEIYAPGCPHCKKFKPEYEELAKKYSDIIPFVKIDGTDMDRYIDFVTIIGFPTLFIYHDQRFYMYKGHMTYKYVELFIHNYMFYRYIKLNNTKLTEVLEEDYLLAVFEEVDSKKSLTLYKQMIENLDYLNMKSYYYIKPTNDTDNSFKAFDGIYLVKNKTKYLITDLKAYFQAMNIHTFNPSNNKTAINLNSEKTKLIKSMQANLIKKSQERLIAIEMDSLSYWNETNMHFLLAMDKRYLIFSYNSSDTENTDFIFALANQYLISKNETYAAIPILFDIQSVNQEREIKGAWLYYGFGVKSGVYLTDANFKKVDKIDNTRFLNIFVLNEFIATSIDKIKKQKYNFDVSNYVNAKIVTSLKDTDKTDETNRLGNTYIDSAVDGLKDKNSNVESASPKEYNNQRHPYILSTLYLVIYSLIFYAIYSYYLKNQPKTPRTSRHNSNNNASNLSNGVNINSDPDYNLESESNRKIKD